MKTVKIRLENLQITNLDATVAKRLVGTFLVSDPESINILMDWDWEGSRNLELNAHCFKFLVLSSWLLAVS